MATTGIAIAVATARCIGIAVAVAIDCIGIAVAVAMPGCVMAVALKYAVAAAAGFTAAIQRHVLGARGKIQNCPWVSQWV